MLDRVWRRRLRRHLIRRAPVALPLRPISKDTELGLAITHLGWSPAPPEKHGLQARNPGPVPPADQGFFFRRRRLYLIGGALIGFR